MSTNTPSATNQLPWWWPHLVAGTFCMVAIVLGSLDHFLAADRWGQSTDLLLIGAGLTGGGVDLGHFVGWPQTPPQ